MSDRNEFCLTCGGTHEPDSKGVWVDFEGYRFKKPFFCICCGKEICARQFAFGRCCGSCDTGACQTSNQAFRPETVHTHPKWFSYSGKEMLKEFADFAKATKIE